jgi:hypothetical protein
MSRVENSQADILQAVLRFFKEKLAKSCRSFTLFGSKANLVAFRRQTLSQRRRPKKFTLSCRKSLNEARFRKLEGLSYLPMTKPIAESLPRAPYDPRAALLSLAPKLFLCFGDDPDDTYSHLSLVQHLDLSLPHLLRRGSALDGSHPSFAGRSARPPSSSSPRLPPPFPSDLPESLVTVPLPQIDAPAPRWSPLPISTTKGSPPPISLSHHLSPLPLPSTQSFKHHALRRSLSPHRLPRCLRPGCSRIGCAEEALPVSSQSVNRDEGVENEGRRLMGWIGYHVGVSTA